MAYIWREGLFGGLAGHGKAYFSGVKGGILLSGLILGLTILFVI